MACHAAVEATAVVRDEYALYRRSNTSIYDSSHTGCGIYDMLSASGGCQLLPHTYSRDPKPPASPLVLSFITTHQYSTRLFLLFPPGPRNISPLTTAVIMCTSKFLQGYACIHTWAEIVTPCAEGKGFSNCSTFTDGMIHKRSGLRRSIAPKESCPICDKKGEYDGNKMRTIKSTSYGGVGGFHGASKSSPGLHCVFARRKGLPKSRPEREVIICCVVM